MESLLRVAFMTLQGMSTVIIDLFFLFGVMIAFLSMTRFSQFNQWLKGKVKQPTMLLVECLVQGFVIAVIVNLVLGSVGIPIHFSEYLYLILPLSFLIGFYHVRYTNLIYAVVFLGVVSSVLSGQVIYSITLPNVEFDLVGISIVVSIIMIAIGVTLMLSGADEMMPILYKKEDKVFLAYATFRFWVLPIVLLVVVPVLLTGEVVTMPDWWPLIRLKGVDFDVTSLMMLPLLLVSNHSGVTLNRSPKRYMKEQAYQLMGVGFVLLLISLLIRNISFGHYMILAILILIIVVDEYLKFIGAHDQFQGNQITDYLTVLHVVRNSTWDKFGLAAGDQLLRIDRTHLETYNNLVDCLKELEVQDEVELHLNRYGEQIKIILSGLESVQSLADVTFLPSNPDVKYEFDDVKNMGMLHMLKYRDRTPK